MLQRENHPIPTRAASLGISIPGTLSPAFHSLAGGQPPGKGWHSSLAPAVLPGLPRLPQLRQSRLWLGMQQGLILAQRVSLQQTVLPAWF